MNDIGALVLTLGEPSTSRALESVRTQSVPIQEVVIVEGVRPFHRALNRGAALMTSPFFLQVDADFILDPDCVGTLRNAMGNEVGMTVGALRDPLIGPVSGVKLFRRRCFVEARLRNTLGNEVDFLYDLERNGWLTRYVAPHDGLSGTNTLGKHEPEYTVDYAFGTYYLLGARYAARGDVVGIQWRVGQLRRSHHPMAPVARVALAHGMFTREEHDVAKPLPSAGDAEFLRELTLAPDVALRPVKGDSGCSASRDALTLIERLDSLSPTAVVDTFLGVGVSLRNGSPAGSRSAVQLRDCLSALSELAHPHSWIAEIALGHGALAGPRPPVPGPTMGTLERCAAPQTPQLFPRPR